MKGKRKTQQRKTRMSRKKSVRKKTRTRRRTNKRKRRSQKRTMRGGAEPEPEPLTQEEQAVKIAKLHIIHNRTIRPDKLNETLNTPEIGIGRIFYVKHRNLTKDQCDNIMADIDQSDVGEEELRRVLDELEEYQSSYYTQIASTNSPRPTPPEKKSSTEDGKLKWNKVIDWNKWARHILSTEKGDRNVQRTTTSPLTLVESSLIARLISYTRGLISSLTDRGGASVHY